MIGRAAEEARAKAILLLDKEEERKTRGKRANKRKLAMNE